jgi:predicted tellurium resistance membrane protein TerC
LLLINWIIGLQKPLFTVNDFELTIRDLILLLGGLFLIGKSVSEIHAKLEGHERSERQSKPVTLRTAVIQIVLIDLVFSFDSILIIAVVISLAVMLAFVRTISDFINTHPSMKILAISFLIMIGTLLVVEALHVHVPKGYIYFAMAFALGVEILNMKIRRKTLASEIGVDEKIKVRK